VKYISWICLFLLITPLSAGQFSLTTEGEYSSGDLTSVINDQLRTIVTDLNSEKIVKLTGNQEEFALASANTGSSNILNGTLYSGLDSEIVAVGISAGGAVNNVSEISKFQSNIENGKDSDVSANLGGIGGWVGLNSSQLSFIPFNNLLLETKFAFVDYQLNQNVQYGTLLLGFGTRYKMANFPVQDPLFKMRSLTIGSGIYYSQSDIKYKSDKISKNSTPEDLNGESIDTKTETYLFFDISNKAVVIPFEAVTSFQTLYVLNLFLGSGFDLVMGQTNIQVSTDTQINVYRDSTLETPVTKPKLELRNSDTVSYPSILRFKIISGFGFNIGPARIEAPLVYYPTSGLTTSLIAGVSF
jgi:hypothetical protein